MPQERRVALPTRLPSDSAGRATLKQQAHNSQFSRKNKLIDWYFLGLIIVSDAAILAVGLALIFGSRGAL